MAKRTNKYYYDEQVKRINRIIERATELGYDVTFTMPTRPGRIQEKHIQRLREFKPSDIYKKSGFTYKEYKEKRQELYKKPTYKEPKREAYNEDYETLPDFTTVSYNNIMSTLTEGFRGTAISRMIEQFVEQMSSIYGEEYVSEVMVQVANKNVDVSVGTMSIAQAYEMALSFMHDVLNTLQERGDIDSTEALEFMEAIDNSYGWEEPQ